MTDTAASNSGPPSASLLTWLRLMRLPTVFTALADILCGFMISSAAAHTDVAAVLNQPALWWLLLASAGLYLGGMVLNDVFDAELDAVERPERPIPSGRISRSKAMLFGNLLLAIGIASAWLAGRAAETGTGSLRIALGLAVAVVLYNARLKSTVLGPLGMGTCRFLNILLGASTSAVWPDNWTGPQLAVASALGIYIVGVTWFARNEAGQVSKASMWLGIGLLLAGLGVDVWLATTGQFPDSVVTGTLIALSLIAANATVRCWQAVRDPAPGRVQRTVGLLLLSIIFIDAAMVFCVTGDAALASLVVILVIPATFLKRLIPLS